MHQAEPVNTGMYSTQNSTGHNRYAMNCAEYTYYAWAKNIVLPGHIAAVWQTSHLTLNYTSNT